MVGLGLIAGLIGNHNFDRGRERRVDLTTGLVTQLAFVLLGIGLYLETQGGALWLLHLGVGLGVFSVRVLGFGLPSPRRMVERATRGWA